VAKPEFDRILLDASPGAAASASAPVSIASPGLEMTGKSASAMTIGGSLGAPLGAGATEGASAAAAAGEAMGDGTG